MGNVSFSCRLMWKPCKFFGFSSVTLWSVTFIKFTLIQMLNSQVRQQKRAGRNSHFSCHWISNLDHQLCSREHGCSTLLFPPPHLESFSCPRSFALGLVFSIGVSFEGSWLLCMPILALGAVVRQISMFAYLLGFKVKDEGLMVFQMHINSLRASGSCRMFSLTVLQFSGCFSLLICSILENFKPNHLF